MNGLGNDFVIFDSRKSPFIIDSKKAINIADRRTGIGCDQLIVLQKSSKADIFMRIINADGSEVGACGNATRAVGRLLMDETKDSSVTIETKSAILYCERGEAENLITVDMGKPKLLWSEIPVKDECDTLNMPFEVDGFKNPVGVNMGNPHAVFFEEDIESIDLQTVGAKVENHPFFPERVNMGVAQVLSDNSIKLRVWERGAGETFACGTGACAAAVAGIRRGLLSRGVVIVKLKGGDLKINWLDNNHVMMTGAADYNFEGRINIL